MFEGIGGCNKKSFYILIDLHACKISISANMAASTVLLSLLIVMAACLQQYAAHPIILEGESV